MRMSVDSGPSLLYPNPGEREAVVTSVARAHTRRNTTVVLCLDESGMRNPFRLRKHHGYIWSNQELRDNGIEVGSIISYQLRKRGCVYTGNTGKRVEVSEFVSRLPFWRIFIGIKHAFPGAKISEGGVVYQRTRPIWPYALIRISHAVTRDDRIALVTQSGEKVNLRNRCLRHLSNTTEQVLLPNQVSTSEVHVSGVVLVGLWSKSSYCGRFHAMCEGIILKPVQVGAPRLKSYFMSSVPRGLCVIINNLEFDNKSMNRYGGVFDEQILYDLFSELSFEVHVENDLKCNEILEKAKEFASQDHSNFCAFVMIVMSHGADGDAIFGVSGKHTVRIEELMAEFTVNQCPSLEEKPKIFIFQACRGPLDEREIPVSDSNGYMADNAMASKTSNSTLALSVSPPESDFLLAFGTTPGHVSWRSETSGSIYIKVFVDVVKEYRQDYHLLDMLTEVNRQVAERVSEEPGGKQQIPAPVHTLRAQLYLKDL